MATPKVKKPAALKGRKKAEHKDISLESYDHPDKKRVNNPSVGLVTTQTDKTAGKTKYQYDPHFDPSLQWAGKTERLSFEVPNISLHIHERLDPRTIAKSFIKTKEQTRQPSLFDSIKEVPLSKAVHFYSHEESWANRLIAGDSLLVMNSLLYKEGMAGKVQMIYIDPPYGIKYNSNFQPFTNNREVKDNNDADLPGEPEIIKAFRDTWELEIHSYLTYLRDRLLLARELLTESGSCFLQINDDNLHLVRNLMDEVFGSQCAVVIFPIKKKGSQKSSLIDPVNDYLIWYSKTPRSENGVKYRQLYLNRSITEEVTENGFSLVEIDGVDYRINQLKDPEGREVDYLRNPVRLILDYPTAKIFKADQLQSGGVRKNQSLPFEYKGKTYNPKKGNCWKTTVQTSDGVKPGMQKLAELNRFYATENALYYRRYLDDFGYKELSNWWDNLGGVSDATYVVQTNEEIIKRCILMVTDPGDIVLDPTCGSGTTASVAERWGRRWITCDTSRVAVTLAKQRLMTAQFEYFELAHPDEGIKSGFKYKTVPHVTLGALANNEPHTEEALYDQPKVIKDTVRCTGPFTVEAVPSVRTLPFDGNLPDTLSASDIAKAGDTAIYQHWIDELKTTGIRAVGGQMIQFARVGHKEGSSDIHAEGDVLEEGGSMKKTNIVFAGEYGPLEQRIVERALKATMEEKDRPSYLIFAAFQFDPEAAKDIDTIDIPGLTVLKAQMNIDLLTEDLRKKRSSNQSYWLIGQPAVDVMKQMDGKYQVKVKGFDYYNPVSGETESGGVERIAMWELDTDYDERSLVPTQIFFPQGDDKRDWTKLAKALNGTVDEDLLEFFSSDTSLPFSPGENKKIAVKIIDNRGIESLVIKELK